MAQHWKCEKCGATYDPNALSYGAMSGYCRPCSHERLVYALCEARFFAQSQRANDQATLAKLAAMDVSHTVH